MHSGLNQPPHALVLAQQLLGRVRGVLAEAETGVEVARHVCGFDLGVSSGTDTVLEGLELGGDGRHDAFEADVSGAWIGEVRWLASGWRWLRVRACVSGCGAESA